MENLNFTIPRGKITAIVGRSGSGKSTIVKLLQRFYEPTEGEIFIGNKNIKDLSLKELWCNIGYVGQEPVLFNDSIKENLLLSFPKAEEEELKEALKLGNAW